MAYSITASQVTPGSGCIVKWGDAGEAISAGQPVYIGANERLFKVDASAEASAKVAGLAVASAAAEQPLPYAVAGKVVLATGGALDESGTPAFASDGAAGVIAPIEDLGGGWPVLIGFFDATGMAIDLNLVYSKAEYTPA